MVLFESFSFLLGFALVVVSLSEPCISYTYTEDEPLDFTEVLPKDGKKYNKLVPPFMVRNSNQSRAFDPIVIQFYINLFGLDSIDEASMTYSADIYFDQMWQDHRLTFPYTTNNYRVLDIKWLDHIWHPDAFIRNAKSIQFQEVSVPNHYLRLYTNNTFIYGMKLTLHLSCAMNFALYPHDTQKCKIQIQSLSHRTSGLLFKWSKRNGGLLLDANLEYFELPQLTLIKTYHDDCSYTHVDGSRPCLEVVFIFKRSMGYYLINTFIPTCLIVIISWMGFWMRPEALSARVSLGVTSLLTLFYQHSKSQESLPRVSYFKMLDVFMLTSTIFVFMGLVELCLVIVTLDGFEIRKSDRNQSVAAPKNNKQRLHSSSISDITNATIPLASISPITAANAESISTGGRVARALLVDRISRILFPTTFIFLNFLYWLIALLA